MTLPSFLLRVNAAVYSVGLLISALFLSWILLSRVDSMYPTFYQWLNIDQTVSEFGPKNRYKKGFSTTTTAQHFKYFTQITAAINNHGQGLREISYPYQGRQIKLLRTAEVIHLQDVANLLDKLTIPTYLAMIAVLLALVYFRHHRQPIPTIKRQLIALGSVTISAIIVCTIVGFVNVFYWLHHTIFPDNHQWFFYYQDSLMTTMMQAPTLFGPISALFIVVTAIVFIGLNQGIEMIMTRIKRN